MSNELMKYAGNSLARTETTSNAVGKGMMLAGGVGFGLWFLAALLPFVSFPMLLVIMVVGGGFLAAKR
jgi:hypothetical protein